MRATAMTDTYRKFRFLPDRYQHSYTLDVAVGYLYLEALFNLALTVVGIYLLLSGKLDGPAPVIGLVLRVVLAAGFVWTAREIAARHKRGGYAAILVILLFALPLLGRFDLMVLVMSVLSVLVLITIWPQLK
jgi:hypothetical protein